MKFSRKISIYCITLLFCISNFLYAATEAENLITKIPEDSYGFIATSGGDAIKTEFNNSYIGRIFNDPGVQNFIRQIKNELIRKLKEEELSDPQEAQLFDSIIQNTKLILTRPTIISVGPKDDPEFPIYGCLIISAGHRKEQISDLVTNIEDIINRKNGNIITDMIVNGMKLRGVKEKNEIVVYWGWINNDFILAFNDHQGLAYENVINPRNSKLQKINNVPATNDAILVHINFSKIAESVKEPMSLQDDEETFQAFRQAFKELGLNSVKSITSRAGFSGTDLIIDETIKVPAPRTGLLAALGPAPLELFDMVDSRAVAASAINLNVAHIYDTIINIIKTAAPQKDYQNMMRELDKFESKIGIKIRDGFLASLQGPIAFWSLPIGILPEAPSGGVAAVIKLKDPSLFNKNMEALQKYLVDQSNGQLQIATQQINGKTITVFGSAPLAIMQFIPCYCIDGDKLIICQNPSIFGHITSSDKKIIPLSSTDSFKQYSAKLPPNLLTLTYENPKLQIEMLMMTAQQVWPMMTMLAAEEGIRLPFMLPSISHITDKMQPAFSHIWSDDQNIYYHCQGASVQQDMLAVFGIAVAMGILMPALAMTKNLARRIESGTNLAGIGKACHLYAHDNDDNYPPSLRALIQYTDLSTKMLESPRKPRGFKGPSYIYIPGQTTSIIQRTNILAYENPEFCTEGVNVLYADTHVAFVRPDEFRRDLKRTYKNLGKPVPDVKFRHEID